MKRIEFTTIGGRLISFRIDKIAVVLARYSLAETIIFVIGSNDGFVLKESYAEVMRKIEETESERLPL